ncbi:hypothetical protein QBC40DRAFT_326717 [Triangularia verruculosa]|uniref:Uncharacterized protein n=1 Tax=Triangularia verruculosa TaxID=2587418 RepID=A0AAN6XHN7_9PEZI|nr:hypothetical protein QBC40DRAFT_326717 [Triangularia verruculosa]
MLQSLHLKCHGSRCSLFAARGAASGRQDICSKARGTLPGPEIRKPRLCRQKAPSFISAAMQIDRSLEEQQKRGAREHCVHRGRSAGLVDVRTLQVDRGLSRWARSVRTHGKPIHGGIGRLVGSWNGSGQARSHWSDAPSRASSLEPPLQDCCPVHPWTACTFWKSPKQLENQAINLAQPQSRQTLALDPAGTVRPPTATAMALYPFTDSLEVSEDGSGIYRYPQLYLSLGDSISKSQSCDTSPLPPLRLTILTWHNGGRSIGLETGGGIMKGQTVLIGTNVPFRLVYIVEPKDFLNEKSRQSGLVMVEYVRATGPPGLGPFAPQFDPLWLAQRAPPSIIPGF